LIPIRRIDEFNFLGKHDMATTKKATATTSKKAVAGKSSTEKATAKKTTATAKPAAKTATTKTVAAEKVAATKTAAPIAKSAPRKAAAPALSPEQRYRMVQDAAYYLAEKNGFRGSAMDYWIAAEAEIKVFLSGK